MLCFQFVSPLLPARPFRPSHAICARIAKPHARTSPPKATLAQSEIANKSYQLEEDEDSLTCTSAVYLCADGTLKFGRTDGPRPDKVSANWRYSSTSGQLLMEIERFFGSDSVPFSVKRILRGHLDDSRKNLQGLPVFSGAMYQSPTDFTPHSEVGWFAMILAVDDLPQQDFDVSGSQ